MIDFVRVSSIAKLHKYATVTRSRDGMKVIIMKDLVVVKRDMVFYMYNERNGTSSPISSGYTV